MTPGRRLPSRPPSDRGGEALAPRMRPGDSKSSPDQPILARNMGAVTDVLTRARLRHRGSASTLGSKCSLFTNGPRGG
jgi:hypothetical protein